MAHRLVSDTHARTKEDARAWVVKDTGGAAVPTGRVEAITGGFWVEVFSTDGKSLPAASGRILLKVISVNNDGKAHVKDESGFEFDVPLNVPTFLPLFPGETITLLAGQSLSCEIAAGTQNELKDVVIESELRERREFEGAQASDVPGWTPGIPSNGKVDIQF
jgi:hypothetical protein